jgi:hypothetical protein
MLQAVESNTEHVMSKPKAPASSEAPHTAEDRLDEALDETFPASDPIAIDPDEDDEDKNSQKKPR